MSARSSWIAIVGMSCRFPGGATTPQAFWDILCNARDVIEQIGPDRWSTDYYFHPNPEQLGKSYTNAAGLVQNVDGFDAEFFGISPREAVQMDPQQRLLLELAWEALEDGSQIPARLARTACGVFIGASSTDYCTRRYDDPSSGDAYFMTGNTLSIVANRLSYFLDLRGPSMTIDTACSSSLVAMHEACQALIRGDAESALVGGVNLLLSPFPFIGFSRASMLSPTGRCRAFDAGADGYVRSDGAAMIYLKPLAQAKADGDPVHAVILASGVNSDGRTGGLTMPNAGAQEALLRDVYRRAGVSHDEPCYVEAHGTGTAVGDPVEAQAIGRAIGVHRDRDNPLLIGSVKTNIGHLEPAAGIGGADKGCAFPQTSCLTRVAAF